MAMNYPGRLLRWEESQGWVRWSPPDSGEEGRPFSHLASESGKKGALISKVNMKINDVEIIHVYVSIHVKVYTYCIQVGGFKYCLFFNYT